MFVYKTTNLINGKYYIGKYAGRKITYLGSGIALRKALVKYGKVNFKRDILEHCNSLEELADREKYWIDLFDAVRDPRSYNLTEGGHGGFSHITVEHCRIRQDKVYGPVVTVPTNSVVASYTQQYVVQLGEKFSIIPGMKDVAEFLDMDISQVYAYMGLDSPKKGYRYSSLLVDTYTYSYYLIEGNVYKTSKEVCDKFNVSVATLHHRCLKSTRINWWKIVEVKDRWKNLEVVE